MDTNQLDLTAAAQAWAESLAAEALLCAAIDTQIEGLKIARAAAAAPFVQTREDIKAEVFPMVFVAGESAKTTFGTFVFNGGTPTVKMDELEVLMARNKTVSKLVGPLVKPATPSVYFRAVKQGNGK